MDIANAQDVLLERLFSLTGENLGAPILRGENEQKENILCITKNS